MRTTIVDVKFGREFDEESKSELRIVLPRKRKVGNAENCQKVIKLLVEKNDVEKYLVDVPKSARILVITVFLFPDF